MTSEYRLEIAVFEGAGQFGPKFHVEWDLPLAVPHQPSFVSQNRDIDLSYAVRMWAEVSFVLSQLTRLSDRQTDRQTDGPLMAMPHLHSWSAVINQ